MYQIGSTRTVNTQRGQSVILSLQKADGSSCSAWACGMLSTELLQKFMVMVSSRMFLLTENEQEWSSLQFVSADAVYVELKFLLFLLYYNSVKTFDCPLIIQPYLKIHRSKACLKVRRYVPRKFTGRSPGVSKG